MDRHATEGVTPEALADAHQQDVAVQSKFSCKCFTYWFDEHRKSVFCLIEAPNRQAVYELHRASHGFEPNQIIEVDRSSVAAFLSCFSAVFNAVACAVKQKEKQQQDQKQKL
jgi:hypothetical protein